MPDIIASTSSAGKTQPLFQPPDLEFGWCSLKKMDMGPIKMDMGPIHLEASHPTTQMDLNIYITSTYSAHMPHPNLLHQAASSRCVCVSSMSDARTTCSALCTVAADMRKVRFLDLATTRKCWGTHGILKRFEEF